MSSVLVSGSGITQVTSAGGTGPVQVEQSLRLVDNITHATAAAAARAGWSNTSEATWGGSSGALGSVVVALTSSSNNAYTPFFNTGTTTWFYFRWASASFTNNPAIFLLQDSAGSPLGVECSVLSTGAFRLTSDGNNTDSAPGTIAVSTAYHVMVRYTVGSNFHVWLSTTGVFNENANFTRGAAATNNAARIRFRAGTSNTQVFAKLRVGTVRFGNNPL